MSSPAASEKTPSKTRGRMVLAAKILVTIAALAYTFSRMKLDELQGAVLRLTAGAFAIAVGLTLLNLVVAAVRWRVLLAAYGAKDVPGIAFLSRSQLVGFFYNTFVPGNVTGDVLRGHATRACFDGPLGAYMVVGLERFFGLAGLFSLGAVGLFVHPLPGIRADLLAGGALAMALGIGLIPVLGRRVGRFLPGRIGKWASNLPAVARPSLLVVVIVMSLVTQAIVGLTGHVLLASITPQVSTLESLVLVPLAMIATYMPLSVAGLGVREAAFVFVFAKVAVARPDATAASLAFFAVCAVVAGIGGLTHLLAPLNLEPAPEKSAS
ncbi:MAG: lysylphosphatidylglycerol synthase transmembrane domain-containing protein [Polyangiaceae bacterium]